MSLVDARRILLQHPFDQAHRLEVLAPVERRTEPQAGDDVGDRDLRGGLPLVLGADGVLGAHVQGGEVTAHRRANRRQAQAVLADALQQLHDEGGVQHRRQRWQLALAPLVDTFHVGVGGTARRASLQRLGGEPSEILNQRQPQHARPSPQLADGERGDRLEAVDEANQLRAVEAAVAVANQLDREGIDAGGAGELAQGQLGQLTVVAARQVLPHAADLRGNEIEVVEDPLRRGSDELAAMDVTRQRAIGLVEQPGVVVQPPVGAISPAAGVGIEGEPRRQRLGALLELLDAGELVAQGPLELLWPTAPRDLAEQLGQRDGQGETSNTRPRKARTRLSQYTGASEARPDRSSFLGCKRASPTRSDS